jgi:hypothetical protein
MSGASAGPAVCPLACPSYAAASVAPLCPSRACVVARVSVVTCSSAVCACCQVPEGKEAGSSARNISGASEQGALPGG